MLRKLLAVVPMFALVVVLPGGRAEARQREKVQHPRLHAALYELVKARKELSDASGGFGGHRKKALEAMDDAIRSVRVILDVKRDDPNVVVRKDEFYRRHKTYPHLRQVLVDLKEARSELEDAKTDFRGKKKDAIRDVDAAIKQVRLAIDHAGERD